MKITLLGTGTSQGIPVIGCPCDVCKSSDPRDQRLRCSVLVESPKASVVIDVGPDFRAQMLNSKVSKVDAVFITHEHNDHIIGLDDLRPLLFTNRKKIHIHAESRVLNEIKLRFAYAFTKQPYPGAPTFTTSEITPNEKITVKDLEILPLRAIHGRLPILGFKIGTFAYFTDTKEIPDSSKENLKNLDVLVIDALRKKSHHSHNSLSDALETIATLQPKTAYLTHMSHLMGLTQHWEKELPDNVFPAYDGLQFEL